MTTREGIKQAIKIAQENQDMLVVASLCVIEAQYIVGEIGEIAAILVALAQQKIDEHNNDIFPAELPDRGKNEN